MNLIWMLLVWGSASTLVRLQMLEPWRPLDFSGIGTLVGGGVPATSLLGQLHVQPCLTDLSAPGIVLILGDATACEPTPVQNVLAILQTDDFLHVSSVPHFSIPSATAENLEEAVKKERVVLRLSLEERSKATPQWEVFLDQDWKVEGLWETIRSFDLEQVTLIRRFEEAADPDWPALLINGVPYSAGKEALKWELCDSFSTLSLECWRDVCPSTFSSLCPALISPQRGLSSVYCQNNSGQVQHYNTYNTYNTNQNDCNDDSSNKDTLVIGVSVGGSGAG